MNSEENNTKSNILENAWISSVGLQYIKNYSKQFKDKIMGTGSFSISINQPIFKFGDIYFEIQYTKTLRKII